MAAIGEQRLAALCFMIDACDVLDELKRSKIEVWLAADVDSFADHFAAAASSRGGPDGSPDPPQGPRSAHPMSEWAVGVTFVDQGKVVLRAHGSALFSLYETFDHELSHVLLYRAAGRAAIPRWFSEGVAIWQAGESVVDRLAGAQRAAMTHSLLPLDSLDGRFPVQGMSVGLAYAQSALFVRWLGGEHGTRTVPRIIAALRTSGDFGAAFRAATGTDLATAEAAWRADFESATSWLALLSDQNLSWGLLSLLFVLVSGLRIRDRRRLLAALGAREEAEAAELVTDYATDPAAGRSEGPALHADVPPTLH